MPDIKEREVSPLDRYLVIATDGLWDVMSNEEVGDTIFKIHDPQVRLRFIVLVACLTSEVSRLSPVLYHAMLTVDIQTAVYLHLSACCWYSGGLCLHERLCRQHHRHGD